jgi:hypothetical protein
MEENKIDQLFREKLGAPTIPADPAAWQDAEKLLRTSGRGGWWKWIGLSAFVLVVCAITAKVLISDADMKLAENKQEQIDTVKQSNSAESESDKQSIGTSESTNASIPASDASLDGSTETSQSSEGDELRQSNPSASSDGSIVSSNDHSNTSDSGKSAPSTSMGSDAKKNKGSNEASKGSSSKDANSTTASNQGNSASDSNVSSTKTGQRKSKSTKPNGSSKANSIVNDPAASQNAQSAHAVANSQKSEVGSADSAIKSKSRSGKSKEKEVDSRAATSGVTNTEAKGTTGTITGTNPKGSGTTNTSELGSKSAFANPNQNAMPSEPSLSISKLVAKGEHSMLAQNAPTLGNPIDRSVFSLTPKSGPTHHNEISVSGGYGFSRVTFSSSNSAYTDYIAKRSAEEKLDAYSQMDVNYSHWMGRWMIGAGIGTRTQKENIQYQGTDTLIGVNVDSTITGFDVIWVQNPGTIDSIAITVPIYTTTYDTTIVSFPLATLMAHNGLHKTTFFTLPIRFGYNLVNSPKWSIVPMIGLDIQYAKSSTVYYMNADMQTVSPRIGFSDYVRLGYNAYGSLELRRKWNKLFILAAAETRYSLNSWNTSYNHKWLSYGFRLGIGYDF